MDLRQLEMLQAVVAARSVTQAARQLGVTQPAVSAALRKLERSVGFPLFRRDGRGFVPTAEAALLHAEATRVLSEFDRLNAAVGRISTAQAGALTIATNPGPSIAWLPTIAARFHRSRPEVRLRLLTRSSGEVRELAATSGFDIGLAEAPFAQAEIVLRRYSFARVVVLREDHALAAEQVLTPRHLDGQDLVATVSSSWNWATVARAFDAAGAQCRVVAECEFTSIAINMVAEGMGVCVADPLTAAGSAARGLVTRPFRPALPYDVGLLRPAHGTMTRLAEAFAAEFHAFVSPYLMED